MPSRNLRGGQTVEAIVWRNGQARRAAELPPLDHVHGLDAGDDSGGRPERLEARHRSSPPLDRPAVLLDEVVQVLGLPKFDGRAAVTSR